MKQKLIYLFLSVILFACELPDTSPLQGPVISFYKGIDPWTSQPTFVTSDTTIKGNKRIFVKAHFAAAATLKQAEARVNGEIVFEKFFENDNYYNAEFLNEVSPLSVPATYTFYFKAIDWNNKTIEKNLVVNFTN